MHFLETQGYRYTAIQIYIGKAVHNETDTARDTDIHRESGTQ